MLQLSQRLQLPQPLLRKLLPRPRRKRLRRLRRKKLRKLIRKPPQRRQKRRSPRRVRRLMMKSQWMPQQSRPIHQLLLMPPKILSHKPQLSTTRLLNLMRTPPRSTPLPKTFTTQTPWDPWSKTRSHLSRMLPSKLPRKETTEDWAALVNDVLQTL